MARVFDINCDMGESFGNWVMGADAEMFPRITTANVACGFHAGDPLTLLQTVRAAKQHGVRVGAHPGLPDLMGFGRRAMKITPEDAYAYIVYQVGALQAALRTVDMKLNHVKPHGAFYSILRTEEDLADAAAQAIEDICDEPVLYWPAPTDAALPRACMKRGMRVVGELYVDLEYDADGALVLQRSKHATDPGEAAAQVKRFLDDGAVATVDGGSFPLEAESVCVHGDGPNCVEVVDAVRQTLGSSGYEVAAATAEA